MSTFDAPALSEEVGALAPTAWRWSNRETGASGYMPERKASFALWHLYSWEPAYSLTAEDVATVNAAREAKAGGRRCTEGDCHYYGQKRPSTCACSRA